MDRYLTILIDSIDKKNGILDEISRICGEHEKCLAETPPDMDRYNELMIDKGKLIDELGLLDDGFTALYERISPTLRENPKAYADKLKVLKARVMEVSDKTALIQARELRIQAGVERLIQMGAKVSAAPQVSPSDAALKYYRTMNKTNIAQSIFVDNKKRK